MEVSKSLQADIINIQTQLKIAIQNHQIVVLNMRNDPLNIQMKNKLLGVQKHIILLGEKQKRLVQQLRKEVEANSTNSTLTVKSVALSLGFSNNINNNNNNNVTTNETNNNHTVKCMPIRPSSVSSTSSSTTLEDSEDSQPEHDEVVAKCCNNTGSDPSLASKLQFMSAVGLVTREVLSELQTRRVERKRRSTANHTQFVYGSSWDISKRKKNNYLASGVPPPPRRSLRTEAAPESSDTLHIPGLPASLTIERVKASEKVCVVCRKSGSQLSVCSTCTSDYHTSCTPQCPQCSIQDPSVHVVLIAEREAERQKLQDFNKHMTNETESLQNRAAELSAALKAQESSRNETSCLLQAQEAHRKAILQSEELTRNSIQRIYDFVTIFKSAPS